MMKITVFLLFLGFFAIYSQNFKFVVYADVQGSESNHARFASIISRIEGNVAFAICAGDLASLSNGSEAPADAWDEFLTNAHNLPVPFWPVKGNHDGGENTVTLNNYGNAMSFIRTRPEYNSGGIYNDFYSFSYNNCHFVVINDQLVGRLEPKPDQKAWLENEVLTSRAINADHLFVFHHYASLKPGLPEDEREGWRKWPTYIEPFFVGMNNFSGNFWGDVHYFWKGTHKGITNIAVPPFGTPWPAPPLWDGEIGGSFRGYIVVEVNGGLVTAKAYDLSESIQAEFTIKEGSTINRLSDRAVISNITLSAWPNPFNSGTTIKVEGNGKGRKIDLKIFNIKGKMVKDLSSIYLPSGRRGIPSTFYLQAAGLSPGIYILKFKSGQTTLSRRLILCK